MVENFSIKVQIREDLKKGLIFGLEARLPIGIILGYLGFRHEVVRLMQTISNATRAYIINADGLRGFLIEMDILKALREADESKQLENVRRWQEFDLETI